MIVLRSVIRLALAAVLASADASSDLDYRLLSPRLLTISYPDAEDALTSWQPASHCQNMWDFPRNQARADTLLSNANDPVTRVRLLPVLAKESGT